MTFSTGKEYVKDSKKKKVEVSAESISSSDSDLKKEEYKK